MPARRMDLFDVLQIGCIALFLSVVVGQTVRLATRKRINPITLSVARKGLLGMMEVALFAGVNIWILLILLLVLPLGMRPPDWLYGIQLVDSLPARIAGSLMIIGGFVLFILSLRALGSSWRLGTDSRNPGPLVTQGIYAALRNPIYAFFDLYFLGTFLVNGRVVFLIFAVLAIANLHYQIIQEEKLLSRVHGPAYEEYRARVGRYGTWRRMAAGERQPTRRQASE